MLLWIVEAKTVYESGYAIWKEKKVKRLRFCRQPHSTANTFEIYLNKSFNCKVHNSLDLSLRARPALETMIIKLLLAWPHVIPSFHFNFSFFIRETTSLWLFQLRCAHSHVRYDLPKKNIVSRWIIFT